MAVRTAMNTTYSDRLIQLMLPLRAGLPCTTGFHLSRTRNYAPWKNRTSSRRHPKPSTDLYFFGKSEFFGVYDRIKQINHQKHHKQCENTYRQHDDLRGRLDRLDQAD